VVAAALRRRHAAVQKRPVPDARRGRPVFGRSRSGSGSV
jgi:hypothetical protein